MSLREILCPPLTANAKEKHSLSVLVSLYTTAAVKGNTVGQRYSRCVDIVTLSLKVARSAFVPSIVLRCAVVVRILLNGTGSEDSMVVDLPRVD